jgi:hypothetical protein
MLYNGKGDTAVLEPVKWGEKEKMYCVEWMELHRESWWVS